MTFWTESEEFDPVPGNLVSSFLYGVDYRISVGSRCNIIDAVALDAINVIMVSRIPVKPFLSATDLQFLDHAGLGKDFQVPVHRCQADPGQFLFDPFVQFICRRVAFALAQFVENDLALMRFAQELFHEPRLKIFIKSI